MLSTSQRRDWSEKTPPFALMHADHLRLAEVEAMCRIFRKDPKASIDLELEHMHRAHCYRHRPILGLANSLTSAGELAFAADWEANREQHMAEAHAEWSRLNAGDLRRAA
ncbi:hypothetical protein [Novosphingobium sp. M1R2S20]|uniref:Uncharacterized protein n=1 Tax=Novosphingobium rhizovicinum TaxID=3228928 RepID=A0ABV3RCS5_9SPHN